MTEGKKKVNCECERLIFSDERYFGMGFLCIKCGLNADERYEAFKKANGKISLTKEQKKVIRQMITSELNKKWRAPSANEKPDGIIK